MNASKIKYVPFQGQIRPLIVTYVKKMKSSMGGQALLTWLSFFEVIYMYSLDKNGFSIWGDIVKHFYWS
jgi:hypothetical protein